MKETAYLAMKNVRASGTLRQAPGPYRIARFAHATPLCGVGIISSTLTGPPLLKSWIRPCNYLVFNSTIFPETILVRLFIFVGLI